MEKKSAEKKKKTPAGTAIVEQNKTKKSDLPAEIKKTREFEMYAVWKSLPAMLFKESPKDLENKYGIVDEDIKKLLAIRTQGQFAEVFGIKSAGTLTEWNEKISGSSFVQEIRGWAKKLTSNLLISLYKAALKDGDAARVKVWMQVVEQFRFDEPSPVIPPGGGTGPSIHLHLHNDRILNIVAKTEGEIEKELEDEIKKPTP